MFIRKADNILCLLKWQAIVFVHRGKEWMNRGKAPFMVSGKVNGMSTRDAGDFPL